MAQPPNALPPRSGLPSPAHVVAAAAARRRARRRPALVAAGRRGIVSEGGGRDLAARGDADQATLTALAFVDHATGAGLSAMTTSFCMRATAAELATGSSDVKAGGAAAIELMHFADARQLRRRRLAASRRRATAARRAGKAQHRRRRQAFNTIAGGDGRLFMAGEGGLLRRRPTTWRDIPSPYKGLVLPGMLACADHSLLIFGMRGNVFRSADAGQTWQQIPNERRRLPDGRFRRRPTARCCSPDCGSLLLSKRTWGAASRR